MENIVKRVLTILFIIAVLGYVIISYINGNSETSFFFVATAMLSYFLISMVRGLVEDIRNK